MEDEEFCVFEISYVYQHRPDDWETTYVIASSIQQVTNAWQGSTKIIMSMTQLGIIPRSQVMM